MLGFDEYVKYRCNITAKRSTSLTAVDVSSAYVYCDILAHVAVGDTKAPLLRIVDKPKKTYGNEPASDSESHPIRPAALP